MNCGSQRSQGGNLDDTPKIKSTHRNRKDLSVILVASFHHFIGILEELSDHADKRNANNSGCSDQGRRILSTATRSQQEKPKGDQASSQVVIPHGFVVYIVLTRTLETVTLEDNRLSIYTSLKSNNDDFTSYERNKISIFYYVSTTSVLYCT